LVAFSGGKAIGGPQNTGFLCGKRELMRSVALNQLDLDVHPWLWRLPAEFARKDGGAEMLPRHGIGRSCKVAKEQIVGALVALKRFAEGATVKDMNYRRQLAGSLLNAAQTAGGVTARLIGLEIPKVEIAFGSPSHARRFVEQLAEGHPSIAVDPSEVASGAVRIDTIGLDENSGILVLSRIEEVLSGGAVRAG